MAEEAKVLVPVATEDVQMSFNTRDGFALIQRAAALLAASELVPDIFKKNVANTTIAMEMAVRIGASPLAVMQNLYIVYGKPGWSAQFIIAAINSTGKFSPLRFAMTGEGDDKGCVAWATENATKERLESPRVSIDMARKEGWLDKAGSKWKTMPELMLRYRAATFFGRLYAPEVLMGMKTTDEIVDITPENEIQPEKAPDTPTKGTEGLKAALGLGAEKEKEPPPESTSPGAVVTEKASSSTEIKKEGLPFGDPADDVPKEAAGVPAYMQRSVSVADADARWGKVDPLLKTVSEKVRKAYENNYADVLKKFAGGAA